MVRLKLEGLAQPLVGAKNIASTGVGAVQSGLNTGAAGLFSLGTGFRDFVLRGKVVELAVAVVLGTAFTNLMSSLTADLITPLIAAIFRGTNFADLFFTINGSQFKYGDLINALTTFLLVVSALYFAVVLPLEKLQFAAFKHKAILRECPFCLEEISLAATRCKHCCGVIEVDPETARALALATQAIDAEERRQQRRWHARACAWLCGCCRSRPAVLRRSSAGEAQLQPVAAEQVGELAITPLTSAGSGSSEAGGMRRTTAFASPAASFSGGGQPHEAPTVAAAAPASMVVNVEHLAAQQHVLKHQ